MDSTEQLQFIVKFANLDMKRQRAGDWMNLQDDLRQFFPSEGPVYRIMFDPHKDPELEKYPQAKIESLQKELKELLLTKLKHEMATVKIRETDIDYLPVSGGVLSISGKVREVFLQYVLIILLLDDKVSSRIRLCSVCKKFFVRVRRQIHCSPQCADRANYEDRQNKNREKAKKQKRRVKK